MGSCAPIPAARDLGENATHYEGVKVTDRERSRLQLGKAVVIRLEPLAEFIRIRSARTKHEDLFLFCAGHESMIGEGERLSLGQVVDDQTAFGRKSAAPSF
jgi:hypothetical protein